MSDDHKTHAIHAQDGDLHLVGLNALRVMIIKDGDSWFAQGLEIDYASAGETVVEAKDNFSEGLKLTICEHLKINGNIKNLLKVAPQEVWSEYFNSKDKMIKSEYGTIQLHDVRDKQAAAESENFPFSELLFMSKDESTEKKAA